MRYIRFLKAPRVVVSKTSSKREVVSLITITSDLGDTFLPHDVDLSAELLVCGPSEEVIVWRIVHWTAGLRNLGINIPLPKSRASMSLRLRVGAVPRTVYDDFKSLSDPGARGVVSAWSAPFRVSSDAAKLVERRFMLLGRVIKIWEETGESIARHLWYSSETYTL